MWGIVVVASSRCCPQHHDAVETIRELLLLVVGGSVLVFHKDVVNHVMMLAMLRYGSWVWWRHDAVNIRMMLIFITLSQDDLRLWYHHES